MLIPRLATKLKTALGPLWWYSALLFAVMRLGDLINLYIGAFLVPTWIPEGQLGVVRPLLKGVELVAIPMAFWVLTAEKYLNVFAERQELGKAKALLRDALVSVTGLSLLVCLALAAFAPSILVRLRLDDYQLLLWGGVLVVLTCVQPVLASALRSFKLFNTVVLFGLPGVLVRLIAMLALLKILFLRGFFMAQTVSAMAGILVSGVAILWFFRRTPTPQRSYREHWAEMFRYALPLVIFTAVTQIQEPIEDLLIRQRLTAAESAASYVIKTFATIPLYFGGAVAGFLFPLVSSRFEKGENTKRLLRQSLVVTTLLGLGFTAMLTVVGPYLVNARASWQVAVPYQHLFVWPTLLFTFRAAITCFVLHEHACRKFTYLRYYVPISIVQTAGLFLLMGWNAFQSVLPEAVWRYVAMWPRDTLAFVLIWSAAFQGVLFLVVMAHGFMVRARDNKEESSDGFQPLYRKSRGR